MNKHLDSFLIAKPMHGMGGGFEINGELDSSEINVATVWSGMETLKPGMTLATARRLAACWNFFDGISTEHIEQIIAAQGKESIAEDPDQPLEVGDTL
jgi:hypothetical protein